LGVFLEFSGVCGKKSVRRRRIDQWAGPLGHSNFDNTYFFNITNERKNKKMKGIKGA
jgi:hypothetical protein